MKKYILLLCVFGFLSNSMNGKKKENPVLDRELTENAIPEKVSIWLKEELSKSTTSVLGSFETPAFFTKSKAKVIGYIKNYNKELGAKTVMFYYTNQLTRESKPRVLKIHEDGRFEMDLLLDFPMNEHLVIARKRIPFYLEPGQTLSIILDWKSLKMRSGFSNSEHVLYQGGLEEINENLNLFGPKYDYRNTRDQLIKMSPSAYKKEQLLLQKQRLQKIEAFRLNGEIDNKSSTLLKDEIIMHSSSDIMDYFSSRSHGQLRGATKEQIDVEIPEGYFDFIKELPLNKQSFLASNMFALFVNRLEFAPPIMNFKRKPIKIEKDYFSKEFLKFLRDNNVILSGEDEKLLKERSGENIAKKMKMFFKNHEASMKAFSSLKYSNQWKSNELDKWRKKDSIVQSFGFEKSLLYEVIKIRTLKYISKSVGQSAVNECWDELKNSVKSPYLQNVGAELIRKREFKNKARVLSENEPGTKKFNKLIAPYKGKIVMVQFWLPSSFYRGESLQKFLERKKKYEDNEKIEFIYITDKGRSSWKQYKKMRDDYGFKNSIALSNDDFNYQRQLFQFTSSLKFVLIGENGELLDNDFPFHNIEYEFQKRFNISPAN